MWLLRTFRDRRGALDGSVCDCCGGSLGSWNYEDHGDWGGCPGGTLLADPVGVITGEMTFRERCAVLGGSVYECDDCCDCDVIGAAYPGIDYGEDGPPQTESGQLIVSFKHPGREMVTETLDELCMSPVNHLSELCGELSHRVLCDVEGVAGALHPPGMCGLWLTRFVCFPRWMGCCQPGAAGYY